MYESSSEVGNERGAVPSSPPYESEENLKGRRPSSNLSTAFANVGSYRIEASGAMANDFSLLSLNSAVQMDQEFNGTQDVRDYFRLFDTVADSNRWTDQERMTHLPLSLKDRPLQYFLDLRDAGQLTNWETTKRLLCDTFGAQSKFLNSRKLYTRIQEDDETVHEYVVDKLSLIGKASGQMGEKEKINMILMGVKPTILERVLPILSVVEPKTVNELLKHLMVIEESLTIAQTVANDGKKNDTTGDSEEYDVNQDIEEIGNVINYTQVRNRKQSCDVNFVETVYPEQDEEIGLRRRGTCYTCGIAGHYFRECPNMQPEQESFDTSAEEDHWE